MKLLHEARLRSMMQQADLDCVVFAAPASTRYASSVHSWLDTQLKEYMVAPAGGAHTMMRTFVAYPASGEAPALIINSGLAPNARASWIADVQLYGQRQVGPLDTAALSQTATAAWQSVSHAFPSAVDALCQVLTQRGLTSGRVGVEADGLDAATLAELRRRLSDAWVGDCSALIRLVRMVKTPAEIALLTRAAEIAEDAAMTVFADVKPGTSWLGLAGEFERLLATSGARFDHFAYGLDGIGLATAVPATVDAGSCVCVDFGCTYQGYFSDSAATVATDPPGPAHLATYDALLACVDAGISALAPGVRASAVQAEMANVLEEHGVIADPPTGHGLGAEVRDWPILVAHSDGLIADETVRVSADLEIEADMVLNLEVTAFFPGAASLEVERTLIVTQTGARHLIEQPRDSVFVA